ncbi:Complement factor D [Penaeus vannamei]|uniref:Complement factor D n=1 Tax=Penaeus vannamei TaxID=6689 RepID=A0A3R7MM19_PENVA|nr:Complement factor D [Penaeus vannamei]
MRLVGGSWSEINEYPWMVALMYKGHFYCGGTLISDRYVLTAAHCIEGVNVNNLRVMVGDHVRSFPIETKSRDYQAVYSVYHHEFNRSTYNHDIGLVKLGQRGDSGGGLMWQGRDGKMDVIAIVSWGQGCARRGYPGVYTRVSNYLDWIEEHTKDSCYCGRRQGRS